MQNLKFYLQPGFGDKKLRPLQAKIKQEFHMLRGFDIMKLIILVYQKVMQRFLKLSK